MLFGQCWSPWANRRDSAGIPHGCGWASEGRNRGSQSDSPAFPPFINFDFILLQRYACTQYSSKEIPRLDYKIENVIWGIIFSSPPRWCVTGTILDAQGRNWFVTCNGCRRTVVLRLWCLTPWMTLRPSQVMHEVTWLLILILRHYFPFSLGWRLHWLWRSHGVWNFWNLSMNQTVAPNGTRPCIFHHHTSPERKNQVSPQNSFIRSLKQFLCDEVRSLYKVRLLHTPVPWKPWGKAVVWLFVLWANQQLFPKNNIFTWNNDWLTNYHYSYLGTEQIFSRKCITWASHFEKNNWQYFCLR